MVAAMLLCALPALSARAPLPPCVGRIVTPASEIFVAGVVHTPSSKQQAELKALIAKVQPDVVLLELDQQRLDTLLSTPTTSYGAELATAATAAADCGSVVLLGDVRARDSMAALRAPGLPASPRRLIAGARLALQSTLSPTAPGVFNVNVPRALLDDPAKLVPIAASAFGTFAAIYLVSAGASEPSAGSAPSALSFVLLVFQSLVALRIVDVFLLARDEALAASTLRALRVALGLRRGTLLRRQWTFPTEPSALAIARAAKQCPMGATPCFTLKRPLACGEQRRLNLFEPRWLSMMDELREKSPDASLVGAKFGCLLAANRLYTAGGDAPSADSPKQDELRAGNGGSGGERTADVVVAPYAREVTVVRAEEGIRPVTGARRLSVWIEGGDMLAVDPPSLEATGGGFLAARLLPIDEPPTDEQLGLEIVLEVIASPADSAGGVTQDSWSSPQHPPADVVTAGGTVAATDEPRPGKVVCIVGLAHANGIIDRCARFLS